MIKKLISPEFRISIGEYEITEGIQVECFSSRSAQMDWCKLTLDEELLDVLSFQDMDVAEVELGYDDDFDTLISGYARQIESDYSGEIFIKDDMMKLERVTIKDTFVECTPQDIVRYILVQAGITDYILSDVNYEKKQVVAIDQKNGIKAIQEISAVWGIQVSFYFENRIFHWGIAKEQEDIYTIEEDETIMGLERYGDLWQAETLGIPWIHHSQEIMVEHSKYTGGAIVEKTVVRSSESTGVRMYIYFTEMEGA